jgi:hypothetical protein
MMYRIAFPMLALLALGGCSGRDATSPTADISNASAVVSSSPSAGDNSDRDNSRRSGALHVTKECSQYTRLAGSFCTITGSNLKQIAVGTKVIYLKDSGPSVLDTDVILQPPGEGKSVAYGHVVLNLKTALGEVTLSGGTGKFRGIRARADVTHLTGKNWAWDGTYSFSGEGEDEED